MSWDGNEYKRMGDDYIFMWSIKSRIQLGNSINNVNTGLIYSVTVVTFEAGIYHERNNKDLEPLTGIENITNQSCEEMIGHFPYIKKSEKYWIVAKTWMDHNK